MTPELKIARLNRPVPRIESLRVKNYRALRDLELKEFKTLTVLVGPNGSGKSTIFDVFAFLSECFSTGLRKAWDRRGRFRELRSRDASGPIEIELKYREQPGLPVITYHLAIDENARGPFVAQEWLQWRRGSYGKPFRFLDFEAGSGSVVSGETPDEQDQRVAERLDTSELLAVNTLGQLSKNPRVSALRRFITGWYLSYLRVDSTRNTPEAGPQERLSVTGDNLPNVIQYLKEQHPERLASILDLLSARVPQLERVDADIMSDGRLLLQVKDAPFERPIQSRYVSDGTLKLLSYLLVLHDPDPPQLIGIEEPENHLHPRLLPVLAEECRAASVTAQVMVTTHSPYFLDAVQPEEAWIVYRNESGYTQAIRTDTINGVNEFVQHGAKLGDLWMEGHFQVGDPLTNAGRATLMAGKR